MKFEKATFIEPHNEIFIQCNIIDDEIWIKSYSLIDECLKNESPMGYVKFILYPDGFVRSAGVYVEPKYRGRGLSTLMYSFAHSLGYKIKPSPLQSPEGKLMWKYFRKRKLPFTNENWFEKLRRLIGEYFISIGF